MLRATRGVPFCETVKCLPKRNEKLSFATRTVHHPAADAPSSPVATPLYQASTFRVADAATVARYAEQVQPSAYYTRWGNPPTEVWEKAGGRPGRRPALPGLRLGHGRHQHHAPGAAFAGRPRRGRQFALHRHDEVPGRRSVGRWRPRGFRRCGRPANYARAATDATRLFYVESPANPTMTLCDLAAVCQIARERGIRTVVDNTFASPYNQRPLALGADVVLHSATKYLGGHTDVVAGCVVTDAATADRIWQKRNLLGGTLDPFAAWLLLRGVKTLALRMEAHNRNALAVAAGAGNASGRGAGVVSRADEPSAARIGAAADVGFRRHGELRVGRRSCGWRAFGGGHPDRALGRQSRAA